ncbi:hypothetical protein AMJ48_02235 [Parcubacteria bacterium DG_74_1]|nr:MAG: hypothetical protein AMJ48_02235 [Parcubacteria bacterium DG_74_1]
MFLTIILLCWAGANFYRKAKEITYFPGKVVGVSLTLIGLGILMYAIRDLFIQLEMYKIQESVLLLGGIFHILGSILLFWFVCGFAAESLRKISFGLGLILMIFLVFGIRIVSFDSEVIQAPFEFFPYTVVRNFIAEPDVLSILFFWMSLLVPLLILGIISYNALKLKEKNVRQKGLLYGLGFVFLTFPMVTICMFISPIYARWGYLIGAILLYRAFQIET